MTQKSGGEDGGNDLQMHGEAKGHGGASVETVVEGDEKIDDEQAGKRFAAAAHGDDNNDDGVEQPEGTGDGCLAGTAASGDGAVDEQGDGHVAEGKDELSKERKQSAERRQHPGDKRRVSGRVSRARPRP